MAAKHALSFPVSELNSRVQIVGFVPAWNVYRCLCLICGDDYWLSPNQVAEDSGLCIRCEQEIADLEDLYGRG